MCAGMSKDVGGVAYLVGKSLNEIDLLGGNAKHNNRR